MSSFERPLAGQALYYRLAEEGAGLIDEDLLTRTGRSARTLVKDGPLRVTLVALGAGREIPPHTAAGPITVHVLTGAVRFRSGDGEWEMQPGDLLSLPAGVAHGVESAAGGVFLLTLAAPKA